jgi:hypothetical protein
LEESLGFRRHRAGVTVATTVGASSTPRLNSAAHPGSPVASRASFSVRSHISTGRPRPRCAHGRSSGRRPSTKVLIGSKLTPRPAVAWMRPRNVFPGGHGDGSDGVGWGGVALPERPGVAPGVADGECSWAVGLVDRWIDALGQWWSAQPERSVAQPGVAVISSRLGPNERPTASTTNSGLMMTYRER